MSMYSPPFHRRILPWIFAVIFFMAAPALVFYTAGYRWNTKKNKVERNGTLIIDSQPAGAKILLNGVDTQETTPITLQNAAPGQYLIRLEKDGYHPWEKYLDVQPEYVTFANDVWLWKTAESSHLEHASSTLIEASPNETFLAIVQAHTQGTSIRIWDPQNQSEAAFFLDHPFQAGARLEWSEDSRSLLFEDTYATGTSAWLINVRSTADPIALPPGIYEWNGNQLEGSADGSEITIRAADGTVTHTPLPPGTRDQYTDILIRHTTGTDNLILYQKNKPERGLILPIGNWHVVTTNDTYLILRDGQEWLSVDPDLANPTIYRVRGDRLRPFTEKRKTSYLLINGGEVWLWDPATEPELLLRQSQSLAEVQWHTKGRNIALATDRSVSMLNLDPRDRRVHTALAEFDQITDIALIEKTIYIAGTKQEISGLWSLEIE